jgi:parallel beta-helix repeat protein
MHRYALFLLVLSSLFISPAGAATYYASPGGGGSCTQESPCSLETGVRRLAGGDTLYLTGGSYGALDTNRTPIASGSSWSTATTIASAPGETAILSRLNLAGGNCGGPELKYLILDRLVVHHPYQAGDSITMCGDGIHHVRLSNSDITGAKIFLDGGTGHEILNNTIHDTFAYGIYNAHVSGTLIRGNTFYRNNGYGIHAVSETGGTDDIVIEDNTIEEVGYYSFSGSACGIAVGTGNNALVRNNTIRNIRDRTGLNCGIQVGTNKTITNARVCQNTIADVAFGIQVQPGVREATIADNTLSNVERPWDINGSPSYTVTASASMRAICAASSGSRPPPEPRRLPQPTNLRILAIQ